MKVTRGVVTVLLMVVAAGCGSGDEEPGVASAGGTPVTSITTPAGPGDRDAALRDFAQCMRDNGVDLPDPAPGGDRAAYGEVLGSGDPLVQEAFAACQSRLPNGGEPPRLDPDQLEMYRAFAQCMRDNGVELPDPAPDGTLRLGALLQSGISPNDPVFQAAVEACRDHLTGLLPDGAER